MMLWLSFDYTLSNAFDVLKLAIHEPLHTVFGWKLVETRYFSNRDPIWLIRKNNMQLHCTLHSFNSTAILSIIIIIIIIIIIFIIIMIIIMIIIIIIYLFFADVEIVAVPIN